MQDVASFCKDTDQVLLDPGGSPASASSLQQPESEVQLYIHSSVVLLILLLIYCYTQQVAESCVVEYMMHVASS